ncbi:TPA: hypothetical protein ACKRTE_002144 [Providencia rettgeri]
MLNTHFLYLLGHLRLIEEQHSVTSLNRSGIGLIGTAGHNQLYMHAVKQSGHHSQLKSVCNIAPPQPSIAYFSEQKKKIEQLMSHEEIDAIIVTEICSDELLKYTVNAAIAAGKDVLLNNIPNYSNEELEQLQIQATKNGVLIDYSQPLYLDEQFAKIKTTLQGGHLLDTGLLRLSAHRMIETENRLPLNTLRSMLAQKVELLITLLHDVSLSALSIQYSHPLKQMESGDVLIINFKYNGGLLISLELFFNTGEVLDKLSLKQCNKNYEIENKVYINQTIDQDNVVFKQLDQFVLKARNDAKLMLASHWERTNRLTNDLLKQLSQIGFI